MLYLEYRKLNERVIIMKTFTEQLDSYAKHFNNLKDLEVINHEESELGTVYIDMVVNDHGIIDELSDEKFTKLVDTINEKFFTINGEGYDIITDMDPVGIAITLSVDKGLQPNVDEELNKHVQAIQDLLKTL